MSSLDDRLMPILVAHHGLVSRAHVLSAGGTDDEISGRLRAGRWERVAPGVYRLVGFPATWESLVLGGVLSAGPGARASHLTAAVLHDIPGFGRGTPEISVHRSQDRRRAQVRVHTSTDLERSSVVARYGIPTTDVNRTLLDIGRVVGDQRLHRAIEHCRRTGATDWSAVIGTLARHARRGRPGIRRLRRVISANAHRHEITDSDFELLVLALLAEAGLPAPELHHRVEADGRFVAEVDLAYPRLRIAIELDGSVHLEDEVRERDLPRQNDLVLSGWTVLRFTWRRFRDQPERLVAEVRAALAAAQRAVA